jgi:hypothetical protein
MKLWRCSWAVAVAAPRVVATAALPASADVASTRTAPVALSLTVLDLTNGDRDAMPIRT